MNKPLSKQHLTASYPLYTGLLCRRPLPLRLLAPPARESEASESESEEEELPVAEADEESESDLYSFFPEETQQTSNRSKRSGRTKKSKKKKHRSSSKSSRTATEEEVDQEPNRRPLSTVIHQNKQLQRANNHPAMAGGHTRSNSGKRKVVAEQQQEAAATEQENRDLKMQLLRLQKRMKMSREGSGTKKNKKTGTVTAMEREVKKCTKKVLWKVCKFIKNESKLNKATKFVMETMDLHEMEGLEGAELIEAQENWKATYRKDVREALNKQRNYVQQELRDLMEVVFKEKKEADYPDAEEIVEIALRDKLDTETPAPERKKYEKKLDNYWNVLIPKVAGHSAWGPNKRHYGLMSTMKEDPQNETQNTYVTASDEAFLVTLWVNCYPKWWYKEEVSREVKDHDDEAPELKTPFTDAKGGQKKFGGWNPAGIAYYHDILAKISDNRKDQKDYIMAVEKAALARIRKAEKVQEKDEKKKTKSTTAKDGDQELEDEETDDENDYSNW